MIDKEVAFVREMYRYFKEFDIKVYNVGGCFRAYDAILNIERFTSAQLLAIANMTLCINKYNKKEG